MSNGFTLRTRDFSGYFIALEEPTQKFEHLEKKKIEPYSLSNSEVIHSKKRKT